MNFLSKKRNLYIKLLESGNSYPDGFNYNELIKKITFSEEEKPIVDILFENAFNVGEFDRNLHGFDSDGRPKSTLTSRPTISIFFCIKKEKDKEYKDDSVLYILRYDAYFNYINYLDLKETQKLSLIALGVSAIGILLSIYFSNRQIAISERQLVSPVEINQEQVQSIKGSIDSIQLNGK